MIAAMIIPIVATPAPSFRLLTTEALVTRSSNRTVRKLSKDRFAQSMLGDQNPFRATTKRATTGRTVARRTYERNVTRATHRQRPNRTREALAPLPPTVAWR